MTTMSALQMQQMNRAARRPHGSASLVEVLRRIALEGDRSALEEFLAHRAVFRFGDEDKALLLSEYVHKVWERSVPCGGAETTDLLDRGHDLTVDKFSHIPTPGEGRGVRGTGQSRVDCRHYYRAFLEWQPVRDARGLSSLDADVAMGRYLQKFVNRHFLLSLLEARRYRNPLISRYTWHVDGTGKLSLWMPRDIRKRAQWLKKHVDNPDPRRPGERERVQAIVNEKLVVPHLVRLSDSQWDLLRDRRWDFRTRLDQSPVDLVELVALEKSLCLEHQRPAIRDLGHAKVQELVPDIFENASTHRYKDKTIARKYGLSNASYSRFGGNNRRKGRGAGRGPLADLWRNTAEVVARIPAFQEAARLAGVFECVEAVATAASRAGGQETKP